MSKRAAFGARLARASGERRDAPFPPSETGGMARAPARARAKPGAWHGPGMARGLAQRG